MTYEENPKLCVICGSELRLIPAGVSRKTQKPYQAFWSCPNRCKVDNYKTQGSTRDLMLDDRVSALEVDVEKIKKWLREKYNLERI